MQKEGTHMLDKNLSKVSMIDSLAGMYTNGTTKVSNWKPMVALGIGYEIIDNLSITAQYPAIFGRENYGNDYNNFQGENWWQPDDVFATYTITAGVTYKFGI